jgi:hypothetical protein
MLRAMVRKPARKPPEALPKLATAAAARRRAPAAPIGRREALAEAPWDAVTMPAGWEREFRALYADELERLGHAKPAAPSGRSGASGDGAPMRSLRIPDDEWEAHKKAAEAEGLSVSTWLRRLAARESERFFKAKKS